MSMILTVPCLKQYYLPIWPYVDNSSRKMKAILQALKYAEDDALPKQRKQISEVRKCFLFAQILLLQRLREAGKYKY